MTKQIKFSLSWLAIAALFIALQFAPVPIRDLAARIVFAVFALVCLWLASALAGIVRFGGK